MRTKIFRFVLLVIVFLLHFISVDAQPPPCAANPIANDYCATATPICNLNGYCGNTSAFYTNTVSPTNSANETFTPLGAVFCATIQNNSWLKFIADSTVAIFDVWCSNCANNHGIQMQIYATTNCYNYTSVSNCWNPGYPTNGQIVATGLTPGSVYYFMIDGTGGDICDYVIACSVGVNAAPAISLPDTICQGTTTTVSATGGLTYSWTSSPADPTLVGQQTNAVINITPSTTTTYTVMVVNPGLNTFCAMDTTLISTVVVVNNFSAYSIAITPAFCNINNGAISITGTNGIGPYTYLWSTNPSQTSPSISGLSTGNYTVTISNYGCQKILSFNVPGYPLPVASISSYSNAYCNQSNGNAVLLVTGGTPPYSYLWNTIPAQTTGTLQNVSGGTYTVTVTDSANCVSIQSVTITDIPAPVVTFPAQPSVCLNHGLVILSGGSPAGGTYSGTGVASNVFNPVNAGVGIHTITYIYTDIYGCSGTATQNIIVLPIPVVSFPALSDLCIDASPATLNGGTPAGGTYLGMGVTNGIFNPAVSGAGNFTIGYTYIAANGCSVIANQTILVRPLPVIVFSALPSKCINDAPMTISGAIPAGGTYSGSSLNNGVFDPLANGVGVFPVSYTFTDPNGCTNSITQNITVNPLPIPYEVNGGGITCDGTGGLPVGLANSQAGVEYYLIVNGLVVLFPNPGTGSPLSFGNQESEGWYSVKAIDPVTGCNSLMTDTVEISLLPRPTVNLGDVMYLCNLPQIILDAGTYQDSVNYQWTDGSTSQYLTVMQPGKYWVKVFLGTCYGEDTIEVKDCSELEIPNVFTPNGDGKNDRFKPKKTGEIRDYKIQVFNRWGAVIYESSDLEEGWDGRNFKNGIACTDGVYFYVASYYAIINPQPDRKSKLTGAVTLVR